MDQSKGLTMIKQLLALCAAAFLPCAAMAQVTASDAWVRATVPVQKSAGAFLSLQSVKAVRLVGAASPVAGSVELHKMEMQGQTMKMKAVDAIDLPAGQKVELAKAGYHLMFLGLKGQLKDGDTVPVTLTLEDAAKKRDTVTIDVPVKPIGYSAPGGMHH
jgi:copper(I)-binding protein